MYKMNFVEYINKYLENEYHSYSFLIHNSWNIKVSEFLLNFIQETKLFNEYLMLDGGSFSRDELERIEDFLNKTTIYDEELYKIVVIKNINEIELSYVNALLKTIEEPNSMTIFFLTTKNLYKVIDTVKSRSFLIDIKRFDISDKFLEDSEKIKIDSHSIQEMLKEKSYNVLGKLYKFYIQDAKIEKEKNNENNVKKLVRAFVSLNSQIQKGVEVYHCDTRYLLLDLVCLNLIKK